MWFLQQPKVRFYFIGLVAWSVLLLGSTWLSGHQAELPGLILGIAASYGYLLLLALRVYRSSTLSADKAVVSMRIGWLIRLAFILLVLVLAVKVPLIHFGAVIVGLFSLHIILLLTACCFVLQQRLLHRNH